jgi:hypothetical protein
LFSFLGEANKGQVVVAVSALEYLDGVGVVSVIAAGASAWFDVVAAVSRMADGGSAFVGV